MFTGGTAVGTPPHSSPRCREHSSVQMCHERVFYNPFLWGIPYFSHIFLDNFWITTKGKNILQHGNLSISFFFKKNPTTLSCYFASEEIQKHNKGKKIEATLCVNHGRRLSSPGTQTPAVPAVWLHHRIWVSITDATYEERLIRINLCT